MLEPLLLRRMEIFPRNRNTIMLRTKLLAALLSIGALNLPLVGQAAEHPLAVTAAEGNTELKAFIEECQTMGTSEAELETMEKKGISKVVSVNLDGKREELHGV